MIGSLIKDDVTKASDVIRELAQKFLTSKLLKCSHDQAVFIVKYYSTIYTNVKLEVVDDGVNIVGSKSKINEGILTDRNECSFWKK